MDRAFGASAMLSGMAATKSFRAPLVPLPGHLNWIVAWVPLDVHKVWGTRGALKVKVEVGGREFRTSLFPRGDGRHFLLVNKQMQRAAGTSSGVVQFRVTPDTEKRTVKLPPDLAKLFRQEPAVKRFYDELSYSSRQEICKWIARPKSAEARARRMDQMAERILETIEAERDLPPLIRQAFAAHPMARRGWELMTPNQRRQHLLGIFYYRTPDARARRLAKTVEAAAQVAERKR